MEKCASSSQVQKCDVGHLVNFTPNFQNVLRVKRKRLEAEWCNEKKVGFRIRSPRFGILVQITDSLFTGTQRGYASVLRNT